MQWFTYTYAHALSIYLSICLSNYLSIYLCVCSLPKARMAERLRPTCRALAAPDRKRRCCEGNAQGGTSGASRGTNLRLQAKMFRPVAEILEASDHLWRKCASTVVSRRPFSRPRMRKLRRACRMDLHIKGVRDICGHQHWHVIPLRAAHDTSRSGRPVAGSSPHLP